MLSRNFFKTIFILSTLIAAYNFILILGALPSGVFSETWLTIGGLISCVIAYIFYTASYKNSGVAKAVNEMANRSPFIFSVALGASLFFFGPFLRILLVPAVIIFYLLIKKSLQ